MSLCIIGMFSVNRDIFYICTILIVYRIGTVSQRHLDICHCIYGNINMVDRMVSDRQGRHIPRLG